MIQSYKAESESLKTVDHNYLETPICFHQSTPIIYSQYPVWVQFVYILCYLVGLYKECPNYSPWIKFGPGVIFGPAPGVTGFTLAYI